MARKNRNGTPFCGLDLEKDVVREWKKFLKTKRLSAKNHLRILIRQFLSNYKAQ